MPSPYAGLTDSTEAVANYLLGQFQGAMATFTDNSIPPVSVQAVWYGDVSSGSQQGLLPTTPAIAVVPGPESSVYQGVGARPVFMTFQTFAMVYYGKIQDVQLNIHASLTIANKVRRFVNTLGNFGGLIIDCMCSAIDPGISLRGGALYDTTRMTFVSRSKVTLDA
jgi:hypothetical protein